MLKFSTEKGERGVDSGSVTGYPSKGQMRTHRED